MTEIEITKAHPTQIQQSNSNRYFVNIWPKRKTFLVISDPISGFPRGLIVACGGFATVTKICHWNFVQSVSNLIESVAKAIVAVFYQVKII